MGVVVDLNRRRRAVRRPKPATTDSELALALFNLLEAGATDFTRVALSAWGRRELDAEEILELCATYASVAGLETRA